MFTYYESSSDIKDLLVTIRNAIDKKLEIIEIKYDFERECFGTRFLLYVG